MTRLLYHENGSQLQFVSEVVAHGGTPEAPELALAATAFYPTGGGQNSDTGVLRWLGPAGEVAVTVEEVRKDKATGMVWHRLGGQGVTGQLPPIGTAVSGEVDAARRWRHMQRHSGEHLLAQAFVRLNPAFAVAAVSMLGPECHLDLLGGPTPADVQAAEALLRQTLARQELTLETPTVPEAALSDYPLRRETKVREQVRLVIFRDSTGGFFDVSACGGTHVPRAAMCAPVIILRTEHVKGGLTRITFMAGEEASEYLSEVYRQSRTLAQGLSVPVGGLPERISALSAERDALKTGTEHLRDQLAQALVQASTPWATAFLGPVYLLTLPDDNLLLPVLKQVGPGAVLIAVTPAGRCGVAVAQGVGLKAGELLRQALAQTGGKGGGREPLPSRSSFWGPCRNCWGKAERKLTEKSLARIRDRCGPE